MDVPGLRRERWLFPEAQDADRGVPAPVIVSVVPDKASSGPPARSPSKGRRLVSGISTPCELAIFAGDDRSPVVFVAGGAPPRDASGVESLNVIRIPPCGEPLCYIRYLPGRVRGRSVRCQILRRPRCDRPYITVCANHSKKTCCDRVCIAYAVCAISNRILSNWN